MAVTPHKIRIFLAISLILLLVGLIFLAITQFKRQAELPEIRVPDFSAFTDVKAKKQAFFEFFQPLAEAENEKITALRKRIIQLQKHPSLNDDDKQWLIRIAGEARITLSDPVSQDDYKKLLKKIDILPPSLALAQAAIESAWGTSRFAKKGHNYFGQWCFTQGCGMVPLARTSGETHEVQTFASPQEAVSAYYQNLNSHPTYQKLRDERYQARLSGQPILGCHLAIGLGGYSAHGTDYINSIRRMIRANHLEPLKQDNCADL